MLALNGGRPVRNSPFPPWPQFGDEERRGLVRALEQGQWWRSGGSEVAAFEEEFAAFHSAPTALAVSSGTSALEIALALHGVGAGDEVLVPAFTFAATSIAVQRTGASPVPVDVDPATFCLDVDGAAARIDERTKAVVPVHMAGHLADMDSLTNLCRARNVALVQDAAHAHGARWGGCAIGDFASVACFSFQNFKLMTAGEGGALLLPDERMYEDAFARHSCGRPRGDSRYVHRHPSGNARMTEFSGAVLRAQLRRLPEQLELREKRRALLAELLATVPGVVGQARDPRCDVHSQYMVLFHLDETACPGIDRDLVVDALCAEGIPAYAAYPPVYRTAAFWAGRDCGRPEAEEAARLAAACPNSELLGRRGVWIHHRVLLGSEADVEDVAEAVARVLQGLAS